MNHQISEYQNELYLGAASAAFVRDSIPSRFQLHWHFAGKCEGLLNGKVMTLEEVFEKFSETSVLIEQHLADDAWQEWNQAYGRLDGFAEVIAAAQLALADPAEPAAPNVKLLRDASRPGASEPLRELAKALTQAYHYGSACKKDRPLRWYFEGKVKALRYAQSKSVKTLAEDFETARFKAHREAPGWKERQHQRGLSAGFAEATALAKLTNASRSAVRA